MIDLTQYKKILDAGLLLDHYVVLCNIRDKREMVKSKRIQGFTNLLNKKGFLDEGALTDSALELLKDDEYEYIVTTSVVSSTTFRADRRVIDFANFALELHKRCQDKLESLTGKKQITDRIGGGRSYSFIPNATDLGKYLNRFMAAYKYTDLEKVEACIMRHIEQCHAARSYFPIIGYYIIKDGTSKLMTDLENPEETGGKSLETFA